MLIGKCHCIADEEGWLTIPYKFRAELADDVVVTRGIDPCLVVYPAAEWQKLATKMEHQLPLTSKSARAFNRLVFSGARAEALGEEGRILLPQALREYAGIGNQAVVVGLFSHLEIWSPAGWDGMRSNSEKNGAALAEELAAFGI